MVEDERKVAEFVARGLRDQRFAVDVANDGQTGWDMASACNYDLIILDLMLPGLSGSGSAQAHPAARFASAGFDSDGAGGHRRRKSKTSRRGPMII